MLYDTCPGHSRLSDLKREALCVVQAEHQCAEVIVQLQHFFGEEHAIEASVVSWEYVPGAQPGFHINEAHKVSFPNTKVCYFFFPGTRPRNFFFRFLSAPFVKNRPCLHSNIIFLSLSLFFDSIVCSQSKSFQQKKEKKFLFAGPRYELIFASKV
jgi:hypothetical protein